MHTLKKNHPASILLACLLPLAGCTERIDIDLETTNRRLVVYGAVTTDSVCHHIELSTSADYFSNEPPPPVPGAQVTLSFNSTVLVFEEDPKHPGRYTSPFAFPGVPGTKYTLRIQGIDINNDQVPETYTASSTMPRVGTIDSLGMERFETPFFSGYQVRVYALDPPGREWYNFKLFRNSYSLNDQLEDYFVQSDDLINGSYIYGLPVGFLDDEEPHEAVRPGDTITLEIHSIPEEFYTFILESQNEIFGNNPLFSGPPANIKSNLDNQALGLFSAYAVTRKSRVISP